MRLCWKLRPLLGLRELPQNGMSDLPKANLAWRDTEARKRQKSSMKKDNHTNWVETIFPYAPCMEYLPIFGSFLGYIMVYIYIPVCVCWYIVTYSIHGWGLISYCPKLAWGHFNFAMRSDPKTHLNSDGWFIMIFPDKSIIIHNSCTFSSNREIREQSLTFGSRLFGFVQTHRTSRILWLIPNFLFIFGLQVPP